VNVGISYEAVRALAEQQAHVVIVSCEDRPDVCSASD
jgi:NAD(P)-dependent dehydrogenase (short-subunit alcohol dehydrogenase family)